MKTTSEKQKQASRENGKKSRGPIPLTRLHQVICARSVVLDNERKGSFKAILNNYRDHLQPVSQLEEGLVEGLAADYWRLRRIWSVERTLFNEALPPEPEGAELVQTPSHEMERTSAAFSALAKRPDYRALLRHKNDSQRAMHRSVRTLATLRDKLQPPGPVAIPTSEGGNDPGSEKIVYEI